MAIFRLLYDAVMQALNRLYPSLNHAFSLRHLPNLISLYQEEELNAPFRVSPEYMYKQQSGNFML